MTRDPRAFFALDLGAATTSAALLGRISEHWRLLGSLSFPSEVPLVAVPPLFPSFPADELFAKGFRMVIFANQPMRAAVRSPT